ncbi:MAG: flagellar hook-basal body protein [Fimbriimonadaceae bacterium]|nr:flagellar hook-basal body protein [Fimbriimonadaceae bacterium]
MQRGVYAAAAGMAASEQWLDVIANNLANASTTGFKREALLFNEGLLRLMREDSGEGRSVGELGSGTTLQAGKMVWSVGAAITTGNPLEVAVRNERGVFAVQAPQGVLYTRSGSFTLDVNRQLVTQDGFPVLDVNGEPIQLPANAPARITEQGAVLSGETQIARLAMFQGEAARAGNGYLTLGNPEAIDPNLMVGAVEASNVNAVEEMVSMIRLHRAFEMAQKSATGQDEATTRLVQSIDSRG